MPHSKDHGSRDGILAAILSQENFWPTEPRSISETGLPTSFIESLVCKRLSVAGLSSGRQLAKFICLPFALVENTLRTLRERQLVVHKGSAPLNDYTYGLTANGQDRARIEMSTCSYVGPAPVPLTDYVVSAEAQTIRAESPKRKQLEAAFKDVSVNRDIFETLGPAVNSGAGLFLYGEPGNGKTTLAKRVIRCFGQQVWIPYAIIDDGQIIKLYDPSLHLVAEEDETSPIHSAAYDERWVRIRRPTVVVGGELTLDSLEIRHDPISNVSEAPLQMKANCGCFLIDDFGRQRVEAAELLNRWIVPLENRIDYLTLSTGKKIQVPFEQLIVFSTNLDPSALVDEAFLRRIPYKIFVGDPERKEFHALFRYYARQFNCDYRPEVVDRLISKHYFKPGRALRRCHPRDLLGQIRNYCVYNDIRIEMRNEYFDHVVRSYFADAINDKPANLPPLPTTAKSTKPTAEDSGKPPAEMPLGPSDCKTMQVSSQEIAKSVQAHSPLPTEKPSSDSGTIQCSQQDLAKAANSSPIISQPVITEAKADEKSTKEAHLNKSRGKEDVLAETMPNELHDSQEKKAPAGRPTIVEAKADEMRKREPNSNKDPEEENVLGVTVPNELYDSKEEKAPAGRPAIVEAMADEMRKREANSIKNPEEEEDLLAVTVPNERKDSNEKTPAGELGAAATPPDLTPAPQPILDLASVNY